MGSNNSNCLKKNIPGKKNKATLIATKDKERNKIPFKALFLFVIVSVIKWRYASNKIKEHIRKKKVIESTSFRGVYAVWAI